MADEEVTMSFLTPRAIKNHLTGIKWVAATFMFATLVALPGIVLISVQSSHQCKQLNETIDAPNERPNNSTCVYVKRYHLLENIYATVCNLDGYIVIDLRKFINNTATINGIQLNLQQWQSLKLTSSTIDVAVAEARTYWKHLKRQIHGDGSSN